MNVRAGGASSFSTGDAPLEMFSSLNEQSDVTVCQHSRLVHGDPCVRRRAVAVAHVYRGRVLLDTHAAVQRARVGSTESERRTCSRQRCAARRTGSGQGTRNLPDAKPMSVHYAENHCSTTKHCRWTISNHATRVETTAMPTSDWYTSTAINNDIAGIKRQHMRYYARDVCGLLELLAVKVARAVLRGGRWRRRHPLTRPSSVGVSQSTAGSAAAAARRRAA